MLISTETSSFGKYGTNKEILKLLKDCGFDAYDFTMYDLEGHDGIVDKDNYLELAKELREYADSIGIICNQAHSFFPTIRKFFPEQNPRGIFLTKRSIEVASILGAKYIVIHPANDCTAQENKEMYDMLLPDIKKAGIKVAIENMWNWIEGEPNATKAACSSLESFKEHLNLLDPNYFDVCLDLGHAEMMRDGTSACQIIEGLGSRVKCLHVHDNDCVHDEHTLPFTRSMDFDKIINSLAKIGYDGDITFETNFYMPKFPVALYPAATKLMVEIGRYLRDEIERRK